MKGKLLLGIGVFAIVLACTTVEEKKEIVLEEQTPEVLNGKKDYSVKSIYSRSKSDIIEMLFQEAVDKNEKLQSLVNRYNKTLTVTLDSVYKYEEYLQTVNNYYNALQYKLEMISDSTKKNHNKKKYQKINEEFNAEVKPINVKLKQLVVKKSDLKDAFLILKARVTAKMIKTFQKNEKHDLERLNNAIDDVKGLIIDMENLK